MCVPLTALEIKRGALLGEGRGGRTLGWILLPLIFLPGAYFVYSTLAPGPGSLVSGIVKGTDPQLFTQALSVSSFGWLAWIPVLAYSGLARDPARSKAGWVFRRMAGALVLFVLFFILAAVAWYALGNPATGGPSPQWVSEGSNVLLLVSLSSLVAFLSPFAGLTGGTLLSVPILIAAFAVPALVGMPLVRAHAVARAAPLRLGGDHATLRATVRLHGPKGHKDVEMMVDTGATNTKIPPTLARDLGISGALLQSGAAVLADGRRVRVGMARAIIEYGPWKARVPVQIMAGGEMLLGISTLEAWGVKVDPIARRLEPASARGRP